jgi:hypothetical protein
MLARASVMGSLAINLWLGRVEGKIDGNRLIRPISMVTAINKSIPLEGMSVRVKCPSSCNVNVLTVLCRLEWLYPFA